MKVTVSLLLSASLIATAAAIPTPAIQVSASQGNTDAEYAVVDWHKTKRSVAPNGNTNIIFRARWIGNAVAEKRGVEVGNADPMYHAGHMWQKREAANGNADNLLAGVPIGGADQTHGPYSWK
jgi:hypothetical protein